MKHEFDNGKYAVEQTADYKLLAYRHGELWQDLTGNNLVYWMLCEIDKLKQQRSALMGAVKGLDDAYCRAGTDLNRDERTEDRLRLVTARAAVAECEDGQ